MKNDSGEARSTGCVMSDSLRRHWVKSLVTGVCIGLMVNLCLLHYLERPAAAGGGLVNAGVPLASHVDFDLLEMLGEVIEPDEDVLEVVVGEFGEAVFGAMSGAAAEALRGLNGAYELIFDRGREANELFMLVHLPVLEVGAIGELQAGEGESVPVALRAWTDRFDPVTLVDIEGVEDIFGDAVRFVTLEVTTVDGDGVLAGLVRPMLDGGVLMGALLALGVERIEAPAGGPMGLGKDDVSGSGGGDEAGGGDAVPTAGAGGAAKPPRRRGSTTNQSIPDAVGPDESTMGNPWLPGGIWRNYEGPMAAATGVGAGLFIAAAMLVLALIAVALATIGPCESGVIDCRRDIADYVNRNCHDRCNSAALTAEQRKDCRACCTSVREWAAATCKRGLLLKDCGSSRVSDTDIDFRILQNCDYLFRP